MSGRRWTRERVGLLLAAVGNSEAKATLLLAMEPAQAYTAAQLRGLHVGLQREAGVVVGRPPWNHAEYCRQSFEPANLVLARADGDTTRFELAPQAGRVGQAVAGLALTLSERHPGFGLRRVFGATQSAAADGLRGPVRRIAIMEQLLATQATSPGPVTITDLQQRLPDIHPNLVDLHLAAMRRDGVLDLASLSAADQRLEYQLTGHTPTRLPPPPYYRDLVGPVRRALTRLARDRAWISLTDLADQTLPDPATPPTTRRDASRRAEPVREICDHLVTHGILHKRGVRYSAITTTPTQTTLIGDVLDLVAALQTGHRLVLADGRRQGHHIIADPHRVTALLDKARASRNANSTPLDVKIDLITAHLTHHPGATTTEITTALTDHDLSKATVLATLHAMRHADTVTQHNRGQKSTWTLTHPHPPTTPDNHHR